MRTYFLSPWISREVCFTTALPRVIPTVKWIKSRQRQIRTWNEEKHVPCNPYVCPHSTRNRMDIAENIIYHSFFQKKKPETLNPATTNPKALNSQALKNYIYIYPKNLNSNLNHPKHCFFMQNVHIMHHEMWTCMFVTGAGMARRRTPGFVPTGFFFFSKGDMIWYDIQDQNCKKHVQFSTTSCGIVGHLFFHFSTDGVYVIFETSFFHSAANGSKGPCCLAAFAWLSALWLVVWQKGAGKAGCRVICNTAQPLFVPLFELGPWSESNPLGVPPRSKARKQRHNQCAAKAWRILFCTCCSELPTHFISACKHSVWFAHARKSLRM